MQSLKQFITESNRPIEQGKVDASGVPCAMVNWRRTANLGPDGVPAALIQKPTKPTGNKEPDLVSEKMEAPEHEEKLGGYYGDKEEWDDEYDNYKAAKGGHELHKQLVENDKSVGKDVDHVKSYTRDSSYLNRHLYNRHVDGEKHDDEVRGINIKAMDKAVTRNKLKHDMHVYSGVTWHPGNVAKQHPDRHVHLPAYTSTSIDKQTAHSFATGDENNQQHVIHFHLKKGQAGKYVEHHTENPGEHEFILPRNTTIKIHPKADRYYDHVSDTETHVWHAHVVGKE
jgi:hypothetical protein